MGGPENGNYPLLYLVKMSFRTWVGGSKKPQNILAYLNVVADTSYFAEIALQKAFHSIYGILFPTMY